jgi:hypothetical protein
VTHPVAVLLWRVQNRETAKTCFRHPPPRWLRRIVPREGDRKEQSGFGAKKPLYLLGGSLHLPAASGACRRRPEVQRDSGSRILWSGGRLAQTLGTFIQVSAHLPVEHVGEQLQRHSAFVGAGGRGEPPQALAVMRR